MDVSIVIPARNEAATISMVVRAAKKGLKDNRVHGEIIVADNNSTDRTALYARKAGALVCAVHKPGYGQTLRQGIRAARGKYIIIGDADCSYDFAQIRPFLEKFSRGYDFVIGNRFTGKIEPQSMPFLHRFVGTPILTMLVNILFGTHIGDINCGLRGFTKKAFQRMRCQATGMEIASEMVIACAAHKIKMAEVPCNLYKDQRNRPPHLRTWSDGWRHLKLIIACFFNNTINKF